MIDHQPHFTQLASDLAVTGRSRVSFNVCNGLFKDRIRIVFSWDRLYRVAIGAS
jgi:hypothetical protein